MRPKPCYWTRKLELELITFVRPREYIWRPIGNTNHHIQQKYKAYAEFAALVGRGFTARSVRDRWVNIRSTFTHNLSKVNKSKTNDDSDVYVPCWPLWRPLQFLREGLKRKDGCQEEILTTDNKTDVKEEIKSDIETTDTQEIFEIRQRGRRTNRPRRKTNISFTPIDHKRNIKCKRILDDLVKSMKPLTSTEECVNKSYWFFGKHVTEQLNAMKSENSACAVRDILQLLDEWPQ